MGLSALRKPELDTSKDPLLGKIQKTIFGEGPLRSIRGYGEETLKDFGVKEEAAKRFGPATGLLVAGLDFTGAGGQAKSLGKLAKLTKNSEIVQELGKIKGISDDLIPQLSKQISKISDPKAIESLLSEAKSKVAPQVDKIDAVKQEIASVKQVAKTGFEKAQQAVQPARVAEDVAPIEQGAKNLGQKLIEQEKIYGEKPSEALTKAITERGVVREKPHAFSFLNNFRRTANIAASYFGKAGSDVAYEASKGAKLISDVQEKYQPMLEQLNKLGKTISKTSIGRGDASARIYAALEDPNNAKNILKGDSEEKAFDIAKQIFEDFKKFRSDRGESVVEYGYAPRIEINKALEAPEKILQTISQSFGTKIESPFSKPRTAKEAGDIIKDIFEILPRYINSQAKEFAFKNVAGTLQETLKNADPIYLSNSTNVSQGKEYLQTLFHQILNPKLSGKFERFTNRALATTYKSQLSFSPRFHLQNLTQRILANSEVSKAAQSLAKKLPKETLNDIHKEISSGLKQIAQEANIVGVKEGRLAKYGSEPGNIRTSFNKGVAEGVIRSDIYKEAIKSGMKPAEAATEALKDPNVRELAIRRGNDVVNVTQFGANQVNKAEWFRRNIFPLNFVNQYKTFQGGIIENIVGRMNVKNARELQILRVGNPAETQIVDYLRSSRALRDTAKEVVQAAKRGEVTDVSVKEAKSYLEQLDKVVKGFEKEVKNLSPIRGGKSAKNFGKMWALAAGIQFLFTGDRDVGKSIAYGSPINVDIGGSGDIAVPNNPLPALSKLAQGKDLTTKEKRILLNFVPGVGIVHNRGRDFQKFYKTITGG